jgi:hypothetical protein
MIAPFFYDVFCHSRAHDYLALGLLLSELDHHLRIFYFNFFSSFFQSFFFSFLSFLKKQFISKTQKFIKNSYFCFFYFLFLEFFADFFNLDFKVLIS